MQQIIIRKSFSFLMMSPGFKEVRSLADATLIFVGEIQPVDLRHQRGPITSSTIFQSSDIDPEHRVVRGFHRSTHAIDQRRPREHPALEPDTRQPSNLLARTL